MGAGLLVVLLISGVTGAQEIFTNSTLSGFSQTEQNSTLSESEAREIIRLLNFSETKVEEDFKANLDNESLQAVDSFERELSAQFARFEQNTKLQVGGVELYVVRVATGDHDRNTGVRNITFGGNTGSVSLSLQKPPTKRKLPAEVKAVIVKWGNFHLTTPISQSQNCTGVTCQSQQPINTSLITVAYYDVTDRTKPIKLSLPVNYTVDTRDDFTGLLATTGKLTSLERFCAWWDADAWSTLGCNTVKSDGGATHCVCNHTTTFTTLLLLRTVDVPQWVTVTSKCLQSGSIIFLALAVVLLLIARASKGLDGVAYYCVGMRNNRTVSQVSLCVALMGLHVTTLVGDWARHSTAACYTAAALQHIFLLASAFWLLNEGVAITLKTHVDLAFNINYKLLTVCQVAVAWLVPVAIVAASLAAFRRNYVQISPGYIDYSAKDKAAYSNITGRDSYPMYDECWINSHDTGAIYTAVVPVALIVAVNVCLIARLVFMVYRFSKEDSSRQSNLTSQSVRRHSVTQQLERRAHWKSVVKSYCVLFPISTLPWLFALLGIATVEFIGVSAVVNGVQGLGVFVVFCVLGEDDRSRLLRLWKRGQQRYGVALHPRAGTRNGATRTPKAPSGKKRGDGGRGSNATVLTNISTL